MKHEKLMSGQDVLSLIWDSRFIGGQEQLRIGCESLLDNKVNKLKKGLK